MNQKIVLSLLFTMLSMFAFAQNKSAYVTLLKNGIVKTGVLSESGELLVPVDYEKVVGNNGYYFVEKDSLWGCYYKGKKIIPTVYDAIAFKISSKLIKVKKNNKWGFIDFNNKLVINFKYDFACNFYDGLAFVKIGDKNYEINEKDEIVKRDVTSPDFCMEDLNEDVALMDQFRNNLLQIKKVNDQYGVIEVKTGKIIIPFEYDEIKGYYNGIIKVKRNAKWGAYKDTGTLIAEPKFDSIGIFWVF